MKFLGNAVVIFIVSVVFLFSLLSYASIVVVYGEDEIETPLYVYGEEEKTEIFPYFLRAKELFSLLVEAANLPFSSELLIELAPFMNGAAKGGCRATDGRVVGGVIYITPPAMQHRDVMRFTLAHEVAHLEQRISLPKCNQIDRGHTLEFDADARAVRLLNLLDMNGAEIARTALVAMCAQVGETWRANCDTSDSHPSLEERIRAISALAGN